MLRYILKGKKKSIYESFIWTGASFAGLAKKSSIRRVPTGRTGLSATGRARVLSVAGLSEDWVGTGSESRRKSLVGWCLWTATRRWSSFTIFRFFSVATCADFSASDRRNSSVAYETRNKASELTLLMSLSSFMIFLTRPVGNSDRAGLSVFSASSAIDEGVVDLTGEWGIIREENWFLGCWICGKWRNWHFFQNMDGQ